MHVLLFVPDMHPRAGGPPQVVAGSALALAARGHQVTVATLRHAGESGETLARHFAGLAEAGVRILPFPRDRIRQLGTSRVLVRHLAEHGQAYDALHVHAVWEGAAARAASVFRSRGKPVFVSVHGMVDRWSMQRSRWKKRLALAGNTGRMLRRADGVLFGTADEMAEGAETVSTRGVVMPNGIDSAGLTPAALPDPAGLLARFPGVFDDARTLLYFSRIHPKKGLDLLVDAVLACADTDPRVRLLVVGIPEDGAYLDAIRARIAGSPHADRVALTTDLAGTEAKAAFALADAFVLPSHQEGFSMAIIEAMALEKPVLVTDKCHMPEIADWGAGMVVPDTPAGVREGVEAMLARSDAELAAMGARGRAIVSTYFDWRTIAERLERLYRGGAA